MESTSFAIPRPERGRIAPRPKENRFTQPPDEAYQVLTGEPLRLFLHLKARTRFAPYCDDAYAAYAKALDVAIYTIKYAMKVLRTTKFPGASHCFVSVQRVGLRCLVFPVDKGGNCMLPPDVQEETGPIQSTGRHTGEDLSEPAPLREAPAWSGERDRENVNDAAGSRGETSLETAVQRFVDQGVLEPVPDIGPDPFAGIDDAELDKMAERGTVASRVAAKAERGRRDDARNHRMPSAESNTRVRTDSEVSPPVSTPVPQKAPAAVSAPVTSKPMTLEARLARIGPNSTREEIRDVGLYTHEKLGDIGWEGLHIKIITYVAMGKVSKIKVKKAFERALQAKTADKPGALYKKYIGNLAD